MHTALGQQGGPGREAGLFRGVSALPWTLFVLSGKCFPSLTSVSPSVYQ